MTTILTRPSIGELRKAASGKNASLPIIAIEPRSHFAKKLKRDLNGDGRFIILEKELDVKDGWSDFFLYPGIDDPQFRKWNLSSLYKFSDNAIECLTFFRVNPQKKAAIKKHCENPTKTIVETVRLDTIVSHFNIDRIDFLDITRCQGNQFNALLSIGEKLDIVKKGVAFGAWAYDIYQNDTNTNHALDIARWLTGNNFQTHIFPDRHPINFIRFRKRQYGLNARVAFNIKEEKYD